MLTVEHHSACYDAVTCTPSPGSSESEKKGNKFLAFNFHSQSTKEGQKIFKRFKFPLQHTQILKLGKDSTGWRIERREGMGVQELKCRHWTIGLGNALQGIDCHMDWENRKQLEAESVATSGIKCLKTI